MNECEDRDVIPAERRGVSPNRARSSGETSGLMAQFFAFLLCTNAGARLVQLLHHLSCRTFSAPPFCFPPPNGHVLPMASTSSTSLMLDGRVTCSQDPITRMRRDLVHGRVHFSSLRVLQLGFVHFVCRPCTAEFRKTCLSANGQFLVTSIRCSTALS